MSDQPTVSHCGRGEFDELFISDPSFIHIERMNEACFWIGIDRPDGKPRFTIFTGVEEGSWYFRVEEDSTGPHIAECVERKLRRNRAIEMDSEDIVRTQRVLVELAERSLSRERSRLERILKIQSRTETGLDQTLSGER